MQDIAATQAGPKDQGISERSLRGLKWNYLGAVGRVVIQLVTQVFFARMLGPDPYGVFGTALLIVGLLGILIELGLGPALVQIEKIEDDQINYAFTVLVLTGATTTVLLILSAGFIAKFFGNEDLRLVLQIMAPALFTSSLAVIPQALLHRSFAFGAIQFGRLCSYIISYALIGNVLAWYGAGIWSLVAAWHIQIMLICIIFFYKHPHSLKLKFRNNKNELRKFGTTIMLINTINWAGENLDKLIISKLLGPTALGLYSIPYNLVRTPANHLISSLQTVLFPASARAQKNISGLQYAYLSVAAGVSLIAFPVFFTASALSFTLIEALFGDQWTSAWAVTIPLAIAMVPYSLMAIAGPILAGKGLPEIELKIQFWTTLVLIALLIAASPISVQAVAWVIFFVYALRALWITTVLLKIFQINIRRLLRAFRGGTLLTLGVLPIAVLVDRSMLWIYQPAGYRLTAAIFSCSLTALFLIIIMPGQLFSYELKLIIERLAARSPRMKRSLIVRRLRKANDGAESF